MDGFDKPTSVALLAWRLRLMARPDMRGARLDELAERLDRRWDVGVPSFVDGLALVGAEEVDRVCAGAVGRLASPNTPASAKRAILDLLEVLDDERKVAMYYALPEEARKPLDRDPSVGHVLAPLKAAMGDALFDLDTFAKLAGEELFRDAADPGKFVRDMPERFRPLLRRALMEPV
jgi:hypothetical protein